MQNAVPCPREFEIMYPNEEETDLWLALHLVQRTTYRAIDAALKAEDLPTLRWYDILWELERAKDGLRPYQLEKRLVFEQSGLSRVLSRIIRAGLVEEATAEGDGRGKVMTITKMGLSVRSKMWRIYGPLMREYLSKISDRHDPGHITSVLKSMIEE